MAVISLLHPSRQRPEKSLTTCTKWMDRATGNVELIISLDADDWMNYKCHSDAHVVVDQNRSAVDAINHAAKFCSGDIMIVVSDDTDCPYNWDQHIRDATKGLDDFVLRVNDGIQRWIVTMPVIDRAYYNRFGYVYHPGFTHMFVDTHFTHVADLLGRIITRKDLHFPHLHYSTRKAQKDAVNERADATWKQGEALYLDEFRRGFGLTGIDPWNISDEHHKNWLRSKL